jgi:tetratricopeptide (TPR) repeat protein
MFSVTGILIIIGLIALNITIVVTADDIGTMLMGTPTPTRTSNSFLLEAQALVGAGNLSAETGAIAAYKEALAFDPNNIEAMIQLSRLEVYSSVLLTPNVGYQRLLEALETVNRAAELAPDNSTVHAIRALTLDWLATNPSTPFEDREAYLIEANNAATLARQLDNNNALALAFHAEILIDQLRFEQATQLAEQAVALEPNIMDTHRVYAYVLESTRYYSQAIEEYKAAAALEPNMTFLYISIGQNYRQLQLYDQALEYFDRAATINKNIGIEDPLPYLAIAKTYTRQGQFFAAAINAETALSFDPTNPDLYGQLGYIRFQARNYEGAIPMLECAVEGCEVLYDDFFGVIPFLDASDEQLQSLDRIEVTGLPLNNGSVVYYYVYGSVLAAFNRCEEADIVLNQLESAYGEDQTIMSIVSESRNVCRLLQEQQND